MLVELKKDSLFNQVFRCGYKRGLIDDSFADYLVKDLRNTSFEVARRYASVNNYHGIQQAMEMVVQCVSLYLRIISKGDLLMATQVLIDEPLPVLFKKGHRAISELDKLPSNDNVFFADSGHAEEDNLYSIFKKITLVGEVSSVDESYRVYSNLLKERMVYKEQQKLAVWFVSQSETSSIRGLKAVMASDVNILSHEILFKTLLFGQIYDGKIRSFLSQMDLMKLVHKIREELSTDEAWRVCREFVDGLSKENRKVFWDCIGMKNKHRSFIFVLKRIKTLPTGSEKEIYKEMQFHCNVIMTEKDRKKIFSEEIYDLDFL